MYLALVSDRFKGQEEGIPADIKIESMLAGFHRSFVLPQRHLTDSNIVFSKVLKSWQKIRIYL